MNWTFPTQQPQLQKNTQFSHKGFAVSRLTVESPEHCCCDHLMDRLTRLCTTRRLLVHTSPSSPETWVTVLLTRPKCLFWRLPELFVQTSCVTPYVFTSIFLAARAQLATKCVENVSPAWYSFGVKLSRFSERVLLPLITRHWSDMHNHHSLTVIIIRATTIPFCRHSRRLSRIPIVISSCRPRRRSSTGSWTTSSKHLSLPTWRRSRCTRNTSLACRFHLNRSLPELVVIPFRRSPKTRNSKKKVGKLCTHCPAGKSKCM